MKKSSQLIVLGSIYLVLGLFALVFATATTFASVMTLSVVLLIAGCAQIAYGIQGRKTGQMWPHVGLGCLALACSILIMRNPVANTLAFTFAVGFLLIAGGLAKVIGAFVERTAGWGFYLLNGAISLFLGSYILYTFPLSAAWTIGTFVAVDFIFGGISLIGLGSAMKRAKRDLETHIQSLLPESSEENEYRKRTGKSDPYDRDLGAHLH